MRHGAAKHAAAEGAVSVEMVRVAVVTPAVVDTGAEPMMVVPPSRNCTVPVGLLVAVVAGVTVAVKVTAWP